MHRSAREILDAERHDLPPIGAREEVWAAIERRLASPLPPSPGAGRIYGLTFKVLVGVALVGALAGLSTPREADDMHGASRSQTMLPVGDRTEGGHAGASTEADGSFRGDASSASGSTGAFAQDEPVSPPSRRPAISPQSRSAKRRRPSAGPRHEVGDLDAAPTATGSATQPSELQLMFEARRRLDADDVDGAMRTLDRHAEHFDPNAWLTEDRQALRIEALCRLDRADEAGRLAKAFLAAWPRSIHAPAVRQGCVERRRSR